MLLKTEIVSHPKDTWQKVQLTELFNLVLISVDAQIIETATLNNS